MLPLAIRVRVKKSHHIWARVILTMLLGSFLGLASTVSHAEVFTDRALWEAATGAFDTEDFEAAPLGVLPVGTTDIGLVEVTLIGTTNDSTMIAEPGGVNGSREFEAFLVDNSAEDICSIVFTFPAPVKAWGADFISATTGDILVVTANGSTISFFSYLPPPGNGFLGSVENTPFDTITFFTLDCTSFGEWYQMDDLSFGTESPSVPATGLPGVLALGVIMAALGFGLSRRMKR